MQNANTPSILSFPGQLKNKELLVGGLTCGAAALYLGYRYYKLSSGSVSWPYPQLTESEHTDSYFGTEVSDPYVWLEDPDSEATRGFVEEETAVTEAVFGQEGLASMQAQLKSSFEQIYFYDKFTTPSRYADYIFYRKKAATQNQYILYKQQLSSFLEDPNSAQVLFDPLSLREDGTASLDGYWFTPDGRKMVYAIGYSGSDWKELHVKDVETGEDSEEEVIPWCKFTSVAWLPSGLGFFYCCYPPQEEEGEEEDEKKEEDDDKKGTETTKTSNHQVKFHSLGSNPQDDMLVMEDVENPAYLFGVRMTHNGDILLISVSKDCNPQSKLFMVDISAVTHSLQSGQEEIKQGVRKAVNEQLVKLYDHFENDYHYLTHRYDTSSSSSSSQLMFWFQTTKEAPRGKVVKVTLTDYTLACFRKEGRHILSQEQKEDLVEGLVEREIIEQHPEDTLEDVDVTSNGILILNYLHEVKSLLLACDLEGNALSTLNLPDTTCPDGSLKPLSIYTSSNPRNDDFFVSISGFDEPGRVLRGSCQKTTVRDGQELRDAIEGTFDPFLSVDFSSLSVPDTLAASQVFYTSKDGKTKVPMFILEPKAQAVSGQRERRPCILYGYGGFNISITPYFHLKALTWVLKCGGVFCIANLRGGGEFGEEWHKAGMKLQKQNVFDDFIAAGEYLVREGFTDPSMLAIEGGSNGGLLVGACVNQRPDLFKVALAHVGVMDMLKFHKFTIGHFWCSDYGNAEENEEDFRNLHRISPYHSIPSPPSLLQSLLYPLCLFRPHPIPPSFPATLLLTADHDDRVVPLHSFKYISMLQKRWGSHWSQNNPLVIRIEQKAGHGGGKPTTKIVEEAADVLAFAAFYCGAKLIE